MKGDREKCICAGMDEYIAKPIRISVLRKVLPAVLGADYVDYPASVPDEIESPADSQPPQDAAGIDWNRAHLTVGGDKQLLTELLEMYVGEARGFLQQIARALSADDRATLKRVVHSLKGASLSIGASHTSELAEQLENVVHQLPAEQLGAKVAALNAAANAVITEALAFVETQDQ
jgi:HPt (histidine-containing phosphotransfer) domain-containing protein